MGVGNALNIQQAGFQSFDGVSVFAGRTLTAGTGISISNANGVAGNPVISSTGSAGIIGPGVSTDRAISTWNGITGSALFDNPTAKIDSSGYYTNTSQPGLYSYLTSNAASQTGDGTVVDWKGDIITYQQGGSNYNTTTGVYTTPKAGVYIVNFKPFLYNLDATNGTLIIYVNVSGTQYRLYEVNAFNTSTSGELILNGSLISYMATGSTVKGQVVVTGAGKNVGFGGGAALNAFSVNLLS